MNKANRKNMLSLTNAYGPDAFWPKTRRMEMMSALTKPTEKAEVQIQEAPPKLSINVDLSRVETRLRSPKSSCKSPMILPSFLLSYANSFSSIIEKKHWNKDLLTIRDSARASQIKDLRCVAKYEFEHGNLEPSQQAINRTKQAAKDFFALSYQLLEKTGSTFPLANKNKCLGMVAIPRNKTVVLAISQDDNAENDEEMRGDMIAFLQVLNQTTTKWRFELARTPTATEYVLPRTLFLRSSKPALEKEVLPRMRCVEVSLMVAVNKIRRTRSFLPSEVAVVAFSGTLWASPNQSVAITHFGQVKRNDKYLAEPALALTLNDEGLKAWIDIWAPCAEHCKIYQRQMWAIAAVKEHFNGPRADEPLQRSEDLKDDECKNWTLGGF